MEIIPLSELEHYDYVSFTGADARSFLQGQVTCNLDLLSAERSLHGALCNLKGRVIADFRLLETGADEILMQTLAGNGQKIIGTLSRYAVFSKVELQPTQGPQANFGVIGAAASAAFSEVLSQFPDAEDSVYMDDNYLVVRVAGTNPRFQLWCRHEQALAAVRKLDVLEELATINSWQLADIQAGTIHVNPQTSENFTPQLLNYDISGVVDFDKGCYTGQEVVARMHYRAKAKKRLFRLVSEGKLSQTTVITVADDDDESIAEILSLANGGDDGKASEALAIVSTELAASNPVLMVANSPDQKVELAAIPYAQD